MEQNPSKSPKSEDNVDGTSDKVQNTDSGSSSKPEETTSNESRQLKSYELHGFQDSDLEMSTNNMTHLDEDSEDYYEDLGDYIIEISSDDDVDEDEQDGDSEIDLDRFRCRFEEMDDFMMMMREEFENTDVEVDEDDQDQDDDFYGDVSFDRVQDKPPEN